MKLKLNKNEIEAIKISLFLREINLRGILNEEEEKSTKDEALYRTYKKSLADTINLELKIQRKEYEKYKKSENLPNQSNSPVQTD